LHCTQLSLLCNMFSSFFRVGRGSSLLNTVVVCGMSLAERMGGVCGTEIREGGQILLGSSDQLQENSMAEFKVEDNKVLVIKQNGKLRGLSSKCTHYEAPLIKGALGNGIITCPWHGACFSIETGDIEDFPGCSSLVSYKIIEESGNLYLELPKDLSLAVTKREKFVGSRKVVDSEDHVVVVGGGAAGHTAVETFRAEGYKGKITLLSAENHLPYDRPKLSKKLDIQASEMCLRPREWYTEAGIDLRLGHRVDKVDVEQKAVILESGESLAYDKLVFCTGGAPRQLGVPGDDLKGVFTLRTPEDANAIADSITDKDVVIVGGSFIGMEVAAASVKAAKSVTVIDRNSVSFQTTLGDEVGTILQDMHKSNGVAFEMSSEIESIEGEEGKVTGVKLKNGKHLTSDIVVAGIGVTPSTAPFQHIPHFLNQKGLIPVDEYMKTKDSNICAAGDIVQFPLVTFDNELVNIGHWGLAMYMGKIAALTTMGKSVPARTVPFFWSVLFGKSVRFAGICHGCQRTLLQADDTGFLLVYTRDEYVKGVCTLGRDPVASHFSNMMLEGQALKVEDAAETFNLVLASKL
jgi:NADPH-dependent 2,4-dienoyl-CoA reductase/sulfur reductase-like enzyme/nitrite reductase/ring-hydroxylating ferredoxin subunit